MPRDSHLALAQQGCEGARQGGAWEYLELGPALVSLDSSMFQAAMHRRAAPSHKDPGAGAVAASNRHRVNHDSLETWPCVSLNAKSRVVPVRFWRFRFDFLQKELIP